MADNDDLTSVLFGLGGAVVLLYGGRICRGVCASVPVVGGGNTVVLRNVPDNPERPLAAHLQQVLSLPQLPTVRQPSTAQTRSVCWASPHLGAALCCRVCPGRKARLHRAGANCCDAAGCNAEEYGPERGERWQPPAVWCDSHAVTDCRCTTRGPSESSMTSPYQPQHVSTTPTAHTTRNSHLRARETMRWWRTSSET